MITRRDFLQASAATSLLSLLPKNLPAQTPGPAASKRPNVLFLMVDDLRCELNCYGVPEVKSPNIDRLARRGVRLDRNYCQYPVCNPSRSSLLTGLRPQTLGLYTNDPQDNFRSKRPGVVTLPQLFRQNGYSTASFGKVIHWGVNAAGQPAVSQDPLSWEVCQDKGFAIERNPDGPHEDYTESLSPPNQRHWCRWGEVNVPEDQLPDGWVADATIAQLQQQQGKPFFIAAGFHKPHDPYISPSSYYDLYPLEDVKLPQEPADRSPVPPQATPHNEMFAQFTDDQRRKLKRAYHAGISFTDAQLGKVLDALDRLQLWDSTIVVLIIDHGYHLWEHDWWCKPSVYELCARVPCIVWAPGLSGMGRPANGIVESLDLYPTLAELAGLKPPPEIEGTSFVPLLKDPTAAGKEAAYTVMHGPAGRATGKFDTHALSMRTDRYRYVEWSNGDKALYDHSKDPGEYYNVAADPAYADTVTQLKAVLRKIPQI